MPSFLIIISKKRYYLHNIYFILLSIFSCLFIPCWANLLIINLNGKERIPNSAVIPKTVTVGCCTTNSKIAENTSPNPLADALDAARALSLPSSKKNSLQKKTLQLKMKKIKK